MAPRSSTAGLLKEIGKRRAAEPGVDRSNRYGWHSALDLFERTEPAHARLAKEIDAMVAACTAKMMPEVPKDLLRKHEGWINVSPTHAMNAPHDHPGPFWSGVYYVKVPLPADDDDKYSGAIEFIDPRGSIGTTANIGTSFTRPKFTIAPRCRDVPNVAELREALGSPQPGQGGPGNRRLQQLVRETAGQGVGGRYFSPAPAATSGSRRAWPA